MDNAQTREFINCELKPLWPKWSPSEPEIAVWVNALEPFDFSTAKRMVQDYFRDEGTRHARPRVKEFTKTRSRGLGYGAVPDLHTDVYVECVEAEEHSPGRYGQRKPIFATERGKLTCDPDKVMAAAENARRKCERLYGGLWITIRSRPLPVDDNLRGPTALRKAEQNILAGPDTPGKRFLVRLGRHITQGDLLKPVSVLPERPDDDIPF